MERIEYRFMDKSAWPEGPWQTEPDKIQWQDEATGFPCLIVRNHAGGLCGYVGVSQNHPWFGIDYSETGAAHVHGGVTFCDFCQSPDTEQDNPDHTICHLVSPGENDRVWWIGFDCVHLGDLSPRYPGTGRYRNQKYVEREVEKLAQQLKEMMAT